MTGREITAVVVATHNDAENDLRTAVLEFMDTVRRAEAAIGASRRGDDVPAELELDAPLGAVTDSLLIAERIDEVIYVCRFNRAYRKHIRLFMRSLRDGKNEVVGVILNGLSHRRIEYYSSYRYYRSYKKYYGSQS